MSYTTFADLGLRLGDLLSYHLTEGADKTWHTFGIVTSHDGEHLSIFMLTVHPPHEAHFNHGAVSLSATTTWKVLQRVQDDLHQMQNRSTCVMIFL